MPFAVDFDGERAVARRAIETETCVADLRGNLRRRVAEWNQVVVFAPTMTAHVGVGFCRPIDLNLFSDQTPDDLGGVEVKEAREQRQPRRRPSQPILAARHIGP
jgi:hypothetical protein